MYVPLLLAKSTAGTEALGEAEDFEMRDVRRDGLIEALLIAFTPPSGLPYPPVYPQCSHLPRRSRISGRERRFYLPSVVLRRPPLPIPLSAAITFLLSHHDLHHRIFRLHSMQRRSRYPSWITVLSLSLSPSRSLLETRRGVVFPFSTEQTAAPLYKRAHRRRRSARDLGDEGARANER